MYKDDDPRFSSPEPTCATECTSESDPHEEASDNAQDLTPLTALTSPLAADDIAARSPPHKRAKVSSAQLEPNEFPPCAVLGRYGGHTLALLRSQERQLALFEPDRCRAILLSQRRMLINWFIELSVSFDLNNASVHLAASLLDRYLLCEEETDLGCMALGAACIWVSTKYEEIYDEDVESGQALTAQDLLESSRGRLDATELVLWAERELLTVVDFNLSAPTAHTFLVGFIAAAVSELRAGERCTRPARATSHAISRLEGLANYLLDLTLIRSTLFGHLPSHLAAAALRLALHTLCSSQWTPLLARITGWSTQELAAPVRLLLEAFQHDAAAGSYCSESRRKYSSPRHHRVSVLPPKGCPPFAC